MFRRSKAFQEKRLRLLKYCSMYEADLHHSSNRLQKKLEAIYRLRRTTTKVNWDQDGYLRLLQALGNPHLHIPPVIHVAGTNGKGSVIAFLRSILEADGKCVHVYTSPHITRVNERIVLSGQEISDNYLEALIDHVMDLNDGAPLSFFEIMTAVAFKAFSENPADAVLLEVGMGGRLDCTNVVQSPLLTIINRISMDHVEFLGGTLEAIAFEKAGIMKAGVPCVVGCQGEGDYVAKIHNVFVSAAKKTKSSICFLNVKNNIAQHESGFRVVAHAAQYECPYPGLSGQHQIYNAALAVLALDCVKEVFPVSVSAIYNGVKNVRWAGRLQHISNCDFYSGLDIWLDCGHNDSAGQVLAGQADFWHREDQRRLYLIAGMMDGKDVSNFILPLIPHLQALYHVPLVTDPFGGQPFDEFVRFKDDLDGQVFSANSIRDALDDIYDKDPFARVLIAGSIYILNEAYDSLSV